MDRLQTIEVFIEVARQRSFAGAGDRLGLSPPAVTRAIAALEARLGVRLFNRTTRHVRLTEPGQRFLQDARHILTDLREAEDSVRGIHSEPRGTLAITAPILFGEKHIMPIITDYLAQHSGVSVRAMFHDQYSSLLEEDLDVAIRIGHLKDSSLHAATVGYVRRVVCASPDYLSRRGEPHHPGELADHEIVFPTTFESPTHWPFLIDGQRQSIRVSPRLHCNRNAAALRAALQGHGLTRLMSYQVGDHLQQGSLVAVLTEYEQAPIPVSIVHLEGRRGSARVRSFVELAKERLKNNPHINPSTS